MYWFVRSGCRCAYARLDCALFTNAVCFIIHYFQNSFCNYNKKFSCDYQLAFESGILAHCLATNLISLVSLLYPLGLIQELSHMQTNWSKLSDSETIFLVGNTITKASWSMLSQYCRFLYLKYFQIWDEYRDCLICVDEMKLSDWLELKLFR